MPNKNVGGRPKMDSAQKRTRTVRFNPSEEEALKELGYSLTDGARLAVAEFIARGKRNEKQ